MMISPACEMDKVLSAAQDNWAIERQGEPVPLDRNVNKTENFLAHYKHIFDLAQMDVPWDQKPQYSLK